MRNIAVQMRRSVGATKHAKLTAMEVTESTAGIMTLRHGNTIISAPGNYQIGSKVLVSDGNVVGSAEVPSQTIWVD